MATDKVFGEPIECPMERGASDTDNIILNITKAKVAVDVTGWTANIKINSLKDGQGVEHFTGNGTPFGTPTNGQISIDMSSFDGTSFTGKQFYDIQLVDASGGTRDYIIGSMKIVQRID